MFICYSNLSLDFISSVYVNLWTIRPFSNCSTSTCQQHLSAHFCLLFSEGKEIEGTVWPFDNEELAHFLNSSFPKDMLDLFSFSFKFSRCVTRINFYFFCCCVYVYMSSIICCRCVRSPRELVVHIDTFV